MNERLNNKLYVHRWFLEFNHGVLPVIDYYVIRDMSVYEVNKKTGAEVATGDSVQSVLDRCLDLGEYNESKIESVDHDFVDKADLFKMITIAP